MRIILFESRVTGFLASRHIVCLSSDIISFARDLNDKT